MADIVETVLFRSNPVSGIKVLVAKGLCAAQNDTMTLSELTAVIAAAAFSMHDGAEATTTEATNVVTITQALTNIPVIVIVTGY